jgi:hypothetical protein
MAKQIEFEVKGKTYLLEYNRTAIRKAEAAGLDFSNMGEKVVTTPTTLFYGALTMHHPEITLDKADELYDEVADPELVKELSEMALSCIEKMYSEKPKNAKWTVKK